MWMNDHRTTNAYRRLRYYNKIIINNSNKLTLIILTFLNNTGVGSINCCDWNVVSMYWRQFYAWDKLNELINKC